MEETLAEQDAPPVIIAQLRLQLADLMSIEKHTILKPPDQVISFVGEIHGETEEVFKQATARFDRYGYIAALHPAADGRHEVFALKETPERQPAKIRLNLLLFLLTVVSVLYIGAGYGLQDAGIIPQTGLESLLFPLRYWYLGLPFTGTLLAILLAHELSHYFVARRYGAPISLPYFIPMPLSIIGTMGAVITQRAPMRNRKALFDIGIAGPLGGLAVTIPLLIVGLRLSSVGPPPPGIESALQEGNSILYAWLKYLVFGCFLPCCGEDVWLHSVAFAAWSGLLVTAVNLVPVGQLDGGHISYAVLGRYLADKLGTIAIAAMLGWGLWLVMGTANDAGWFWVTWGLINLGLNRYHPPPLDDSTPVGVGRTIIGLGMLLLFILLVMPEPLRQVTF